MDAFFASVEQQDNADYRGKPLVVGYAQSRSVVAAASYEARQWGVRSGMPSLQALRKCPHLIFAAPRFDRYKEVSAQVMRIFRSYTDLVEPLSLDEAFLDVTTNKRGINTATEIARRIKTEIYEQTGLTASAGVSYNKFLAKVASDYNKPNGLFIIKPHEGEAFAARLKVEQFFGVGRVTAEEMHRHHIYIGADIKALPPIRLTQLFGKRGIYFYENAHGRDDRPVTPDYERKSVGAETTLEADTTDRHLLQTTLDALAEEVMLRVRQKAFEAHCATLKIKYADFHQITRSMTLSYAIRSTELLRQIGRRLLAEVNTNMGIRLIGISLKRSDAATHQPYTQLTIDFGD